MSEDPLETLAKRHRLSPAALDELRALWFGAAPTRPPAMASPNSETVHLDSIGDSIAGSLDDVSTDETTRSLITYAPPAAVEDRYVDLGQLGEGGMGEVRRVRDTELNRVLAMKIVAQRLLDHPGALAKFIEEAQATAQLQHPSIVPVHDIGQLPDGRYWFTMKEIQGRTLADVVTDLHRTHTDTWQTADSAWTAGWGLRRVITAFHAVCQAVAYAHDRGVVHRDLKPQNIMVGDFGEVYVLDWGLAKVLGRAEEPVVERSEDSDWVESSRSDEYATRQGAIAGTPAYMPPEQASGLIDRIGPWSDVYALGAILYEILSGRPPYTGPGRAVLFDVITGPPPACGPGRDAEGLLLGPEPPADLVAVCERAMARKAEDRYPGAGAMADAIQAWLDGRKRRSQALALTQRALDADAEAERLDALASELRTEAEALLEGIPRWEGEDRKAPGWKKAADAARAELDARLQRLEAEETLRAALQIDPNLPEARVEFCRRQLTRHRAAELARDAEEEAESHALLAAHAIALPERHPMRDTVTAYLAGDGALTLATDPPGAEVLLYQYREQNRRLVPRFLRSLGQTPLREVSLPMGSYLCEIRHPRRVPVRYPVHIDRQAHWSGVPPGASEATPIWLPPPDWLGPDDIYVPAGWFRVGGDPECGSFPAGRAWCDAMVFARDPVTNAQYLAFLNDLASRGFVKRALTHVPRERVGAEGIEGARIYGFEDERFHLRPDVDGDIWLEDWPVVMVDWHDATTYAAWLAERTGRPWRLPAELEWEKAARGVDGRWYPWGDHFDPSWCAMTDSHRARRLLARVDDFPVDTSVFGVRGMAGNVEDWCADLHEPDAPHVQDGRVVAPAPDPDASPLRHRSVRGGTWTSDQRRCRLALRLRNDPRGLDTGSGFRVMYRVEPDRVG